VNGIADARVTASLDGFEAITGTSLDPGQRAMVTAFAADDRLLLAGVGPAGAGKTTAMRASPHPDSAAAVQPPTACASSLSIRATCSSSAKQVWRERSCSARSC
jgi:hypothetical protein